MQGLLTLYMATLKLKVPHLFANLADSAVNFEFFAPNTMLHPIWWCHIAHAAVGVVPICMLFML